MTPWCDCKLPRSYVRDPELDDYVHSGCMRPSKAIYDLHQKC